MIELHERLSEFSYGYGISREVERLLAARGVSAVPFMPSLLQEKKLGFDVSFSGGGIPLLLQFKLGQSLTRFVRSDLSQPGPALERPFFRFSINTAEVDGQYETLLKAESDGAEVYYVAPRFADWPHYINLFQQEEVLEHSVMVTPMDIRNALIAQGAPDGPHRLVYDRGAVHVCSSPVNVRDVRPTVLAETVVNRVHDGVDTLGNVMRRVYSGLAERSAIRRPHPLRTSRESNVEAGAERPGLTFPGFDERLSYASTRLQRAKQLEQLRVRSKSEDDAVAAAVGLEFWGLGIQLFLVVDESKE